MHTKRLQADLVQMIHFDFCTTACSKNADQALLSICTRTFTAVRVTDKLSLVMFMKCMPGYSRAAGGFMCIYISQHNLWNSTFSSCFWKRDVVEHLTLVQRLWVQTQLGSNVFSAYSVPYIWHHLCGGLKTFSPTHLIFLFWDSEKTC